ncbi:flavoprotein [Xenorhabdus hominickii]|uniref:Flavoprotein n=1 Tax=Xenorhabdus hominickii TaxID=351679 RepID=A0A2G0Q8G0_XENHO|nr:flavoprotein [Xenorhabdus hominickii]AOM41240.1 flavoprotein [Xenorhabdus hominickii]PHM55508.1 pantothenate metabolism flavoprotein [Xenorhabdus hominickii]PHM57127.1 pantothenate metabolism flavoprotein [Xenorhabdus hominickii]
MKNDEIIQPIKPRILIGTTGSVDITLLPRYLSAIKATIDCTLTVLMTNSATTFLPAATMALYADRIISGENPQDWPTDKPSRIVADHDLMAILPATANTLAAVAHGSAPNRLTTVILASTFPVLFFPVMGSVMWEKNATHRNINQLRDDGYHVIEPMWHENFDASLKRMVGHPSLPDIETVISLLRQHLPE